MSKTDPLAGSSDQVCCLLLPGRSCGGATIRSRAETIANKECDNRHFAGGGRAFYEQGNGRGKEVTSSSY